MSFRFASAAFAAVFLSATGALALSIDEVGGPAEQPPASFAGGQFVDSRGCVFMRAGLDGQTAWVPRIDRNRQVICDRPPTFGAPPPSAAVAEVEPPPVVAPLAQTAAADVVAPAAPRRAGAAPAAARQPAVAARGTGRKIGCFADVPVPLRVRLTTGDTAVLCTRGDGSLQGARVPIYPDGADVLPRLGEPGQVVVAVRAAAGDPPPGYRAAWQDDRLNPQRGPRTAEGQAEQDRVWTRDVPARAIAPGEARAATGAEVPQNRLYVQVGAFRVHDNAARARETLRAIGLPTARGEMPGLTMVFAGPFATQDEARVAQVAARSAGFGDAFIR